MELKGLKINFLGDSITQGVGVRHIEDTYWNKIARKSGAICRGYGVSATRIARNFSEKNEKEESAYFNSRVDDMDRDADVVVVFGGTNDYGHGDAPLGNINDTDEYTFYGAYNTLIQHLFANFPDARLVIMTPLHRCGENEPINEIGVRNVTNLYGYVEAIRNIARKYAIPVIDLYENSGINAKNTEQIIKYIPDGLHPCEAGTERMADYIIAQLKTF